MALCCHVVDFIKDMDAAHNRLQGRLLDKRKFRSGCGAHMRTQRHHHVPHLRSMYAPEYTLLQQLLNHLSVRPHDMLPVPAVRTHTHTRSRSEDMRVHHARTKTKHSGMDIGT